MADRFYVTTPIYYVNAVPHIGHAYTTIAADVLARYYRSCGREVFFLTGTDEHGQKVARAARERGVPPKVHADELSANFRNLWPKLHCEPSAFLRTTDPEHQAEVRRLMAALYERGLIEKRSYEGWYCTPCERYWTEKELTAARACPDCGRTTEALTEENYFFLMSRFGTALEAHLLANPGYVRPESRRNEVLGFLRGGLEDLCISRPRRRLSWGIPLPFDEEFVTYVWCDALTNYLSATRYLSPDRDRLDPDAAQARWWPADVHLIGKDILTTHAVYWSTMLLALDLPLPRTMFAHGWWTVEGQKMSKSLGNFVDPAPVAERCGVDAFRYFLLREVPFGLDGDFSEAALRSRINTDLANDLGNLQFRVLKMVETYCEGRVPEPRAGHDEALAQEARSALEAYHRSLGQDLAFGRALDAAFGLVRRLNRYVDFSGPWALHRRGETARLGTVLYSSLEGMRFAAAMLWPFMPEKATDLAASLGPEVRPVLDGLTWGDLPVSAPIRRGPPLFPRLEEPEAAVVPTPPPAKAVAAEHGTAPILPEQFLAVDLRAGRVVEAAPHPNADQLLVLEVDLGEGRPRTIVAGIAASYRPADLVGRQVLVVANLKAARIRGVLSEGMLLAAGSDPSSLVLAGFDREVPPGTRVK